MSDKRASKRGRASSSSSKNLKTASSNPQPPSSLASVETPLLGYTSSSNYAYPSNLQTSFPPSLRGPSSTFPPLSPALPSPYSQPPPGKLLLPPLPRPQVVGGSNKEKNRTPHACDKCRKAKAKCSGGQPCDKCRNEKKECVYGDGKRDKERKEMDTLQQRYEKVSKRNDHLLDALRSVKSSVMMDPMLKKHVDLLLKSPTPASDDEDDIPSPSSSQLSSPAPSPPISLANSGRAGSNSSLDVIREDTNRDASTRAAGFLGKSSAVSWVQRAKREVTGQRQLSRGSPENPIAMPKGAFGASAYHAESSDFPSLDIEVDALAWPEPILADLLVETYFEKVHVVFPVISKTDFMSNYSRFPRESPHLDSEQQAWLSLLNFVLAIGSHYRSLNGAAYEENARDHLVFYARARQLGIDGRTLYSDPEVGHTSCLGLLALYLLCTDQLNRAWTITGITIRHAVALGLHVRSEAADLPDVDKELRVRLWWSLYSLERLLAELMGRPSCISDRDVSTPLPINMDESIFHRETPLYSQRHPSNTSSTTAKSSPSKIHGKGKGSSSRSSTTGTSTSRFQVTSPSEFPDAYSFAFTIPTVRLPLTTSTYFIYRTSLSIVSHEILSQLYCASLVNAKWPEVQNTIHRLEVRLKAWRDSLPPEYDFSASRTVYRLSTPEDLNLATQRAGLAMFYHSSRMTLFRPTLCRLESRFPNETEKSRSFDRESVTACVNSARATIDALPDTDTKTDPSNFAPRTHEFYTTITPFWQSLHCLIEAASVLMLELAYRAEHVPGQAAALLQDSKKAVLWLRALSDESVAARKGWEVFDQLLRTVAPRVGGVTWDMPSDAPRPRGWRGTRFGAGEPDDGVNMESSGAVGGIGIQPHQQQGLVQSQPEQQPTFHAPTSISVSASGPPFYPTGTWVEHMSQPETTSYSDSGYGSMALTGSEAQAANISNYGYMSVLQPFSAAGQVYGRYDEFGPWHSAFFGHGAAEGAGMDMHGLQLGTTAGDGGGGYMGSGMGYDWIAGGGRGGSGSGGGS